MTAPSREQMDALNRLFEQAGHQMVAPPILHPADLFLDLVGENIRSRLYIAPAMDGRDMAMRPEFTIPVCLHHIGGNVGDSVSRPGRYAYSGPIFRQNSLGRSGEAFQVGMEWIGEQGECADQDARVLEKALEAVQILGVGAPIIRIGDQGLFDVLLEALDIPTVWKRRLTSAFGEPELMQRLLARIERALESTEHNDFSYLEGASPEQARDSVRSMLSIAGIPTVGGRTAEEIANRFLEKAELSSSRGWSSEKVAALRAFLALAAPADRIIADLKAFEQTWSLAFGRALDVLAARFAAMQALGLTLQDMTFATGFGRRLDYYSGFVFDLSHPQQPGQRPIAGGGRYDTLLPLLGAPSAVSAFGFAVWTDRVVCGEAL